MSEPHRSRGCAPSSIGGPSLYIDDYVAGNGRAYRIGVETDLTDGSRWIFAIDGEGNYPLQAKISTPILAGSNAWDTVETLLRELRTALDGLP